jgi:hypothetical protein
LILTEHKGENMRIDYSPKFLETIKNCSHIANTIAIQKSGDRNIISHKNNVMAFRMETEKEMFSVDEPIGFLDFKEFYSIMNTIGQMPSVEIDKNVLTIRPESKNMELMYVLADYNNINKVEKNPQLVANEAKFVLESTILEKMKSLSKLLGLSNDLNKPRIDIISKDKKIKMLFKDNSERGSNNFEYVFENESETPEDFQESININAILDLPNGSYDISISTKEIKLIKMELKNTENFVLKFFVGYLKQ